MAAILKKIVKNFYLMSTIVCVCFHMQVSAETIKILSPLIKVSMRDHGYVLGDFIHESVEITLADGQTIHPQSLPLTGYVSPWLDLNKVQMDQRGQQVKIDLTWQIFASVEMTQVLKTPEILLQMDGKSPQKIRVPAQSFYYASTLPPAVADIQRRENLPPVLAKTFPPMLGATGFIVLALMLLICWLWMKDYLLWWPYVPGPIVQLARTVKGKSRIQAQEIRAVYHALNQCAGQNLYANDCHVLFERASYLLPYQAEIRRFLQLANQYMYQHQALGVMRSQQENNDLGESAWLFEAALAERIFRRHSRQKNSQFLAHKNTHA